ncbi:hypothetical protein K469DRAFT_698932 [Zopfia rhizophila CBS 207.26]|uniref:SET domain-containing protein n=1 Tax=Zopfia rhizophila CBS 207.26 TaxID=1314779 RepID=A0A6A6EYY9_9PEZI|nr:hypothetical protein K469DRAFT_698932 [Zopfia rhizophila CBS 207.26]
MLHRPRATKSSGSHSGSGNAGIPRNWPSGIVYLRAPSYSKKLTNDALKSLIVVKSVLPATEQPRKSAGPYTNVKITKISNSSHPAHGQHGLFASERLLPDSFILPYLGYIHDNSDMDGNSDYDLSLDREVGVGVDSSKMGNEARFINDYRGLSAGPNAEFRETWIDVGNSKVEKRMGVFVLRAGKSGKRAKGIAKGEEILVSYGKGFWNERQLDE